VKLAVPKECRPGERRVAVTPENVSRLIKMGFAVAVEHDAGAAASFGDNDYVAAGAEIVADTRAIWQTGDILLKVQPPSVHPALNVHEADLIREGGTLISFLYPGKNKDIVDKLAARKATAIAVDQIPRITRAQKMDALSSMANIAGYRAVVEAASFYGRFFTGQMTAAGRVPPAKILVIGAGVAGLAAIGAARGMGAIVRAFDTRPTVKEQVKSMGAEFIELNVVEDGEGAGGYAKEMSPAFIKAEMAMFAAQAKDVDIIITTALIPNRPAPILITEEMVKSMKNGSVIVDLAAENGGNCALTEPGQVVERHGDHILGYTDLPSRLAPTASLLTHLTVFLLACIIGWHVIWNVTPALHTPLMSVTNAISGIIVIGGMLQVSGPPTSTIVILGAAAILLATINIAGGFLVTQRMLKMFRR